MVASLRDLDQEGAQFVFTDRHAYLTTARFFNSLSNLSQIDWAILQARDFKRDENDLGKIERYQAEALIHSTVPVESLRGIVCYSDGALELVSAACAEQQPDLKIIKNPGWYF